jgi:hypothetical protein
MHSYIDVITNSSTEIYISTHSQSVEYVRGIINSVLKAGQSKYTCDDLFIVQTTEPENSSSYCDYEENNINILPKANLPIEVMEAAKYINSVIQNIFHIEATENR